MRQSRLTSLQGEVRRAAGCRGELRDAEASCGMPRLAGHEASQRSQGSERGERVRYQFHSPRLASWPSLNAIYKKMHYQEKKFGSLSSQVGSAMVVLAWF